MRITLVVADADLSGGCRVIAMHARGLAARGHVVRVVAPRPWAPSLRQRARRWLRGVPWPRAISPSISHFDLAGVPVERGRAADRVRLSDLPDADVLVATWWETAEWIARAPRDKGARAHFVQGWERHVEGMPGARVDAALRLPSHKLVVSRFLAEVVRDVSGDDDVTLVPNAVDAGVFDAPPRGRRARPTVGLVYASARSKGLDAALAAIAKVRTRRPDVQVVAFGAEPVRPALPLPEGATFELRPAQARIAALYASADVWISASRLEGFGLPALEAMACRTPLVSTRYGGPRDFVRDGVDGHLVDVDDVAGLAAGLEAVLGLDEDAWRRMSDAAHATGHALGWGEATARFEAGLVRAIERAAGTAAESAPAKT